MRNRVKSILADHDVSPPIFAAMRVLGEPLSMRDVAGQLACDASYVTGLADQLEERGLAERRDHPTDRRVKQLVLTDEGRRLRVALLHEVEAAHVAFHTLTDDEVETLARLLRKVLAAGFRGRDRG